MGQFPQAYTAKLEFAEDRARPAATLAAGVVAHAKALRPRLLDDE